MNNIATEVTINFTSFSVLTLTVQNNHKKMTGLARDGYFFRAGAKINLVT